MRTTPQLRCRFRSRTTFSYKIEYNSTRYTQTHDKWNCGARRSFSICFSASQKSRGGKRPHYKFSPAKERCLHAHARATSFKESHHGFPRDDVCSNRHASEFSSSLVSFENVFVFPAAAASAAEKAGADGQSRRSMSRFQRCSGRRSGPEERLVENDQRGYRRPRARVALDSGGFARAH